MKIFAPFVRFFPALVAAPALCMLSGPVHAASVTGIRMWVAPDYSRFVFDSDVALRYRMFRLKAAHGKPNRIVIDFHKSRLSSPLPNLPLRGSVVSRIRSAKHGRGLRVVFDLLHKAKASSFQLGPYGEHRNRLVVDIDHPAQTRAPAANKDKAQPNPPAVPYRSEQAKKIIVIDPGHGGEDPGARGQMGTLEKDVALQIARRVAVQLNKKPRWYAVLTRDGDYFLSLRERIRIARREKADLFVSVHADSVRNRHAKGGSVYILSHKGASDEASRWLATKENASDLVGGVRIKDRDDLLAKVILNLSQTATLRQSKQLADRVLAALGAAQHLHSAKVKSAKFVVLKAPDIPSVLVETAFISNPREEKKLRRISQQRRIAAAIAVGIEKYLAGQRPVPVVALRQHVIVRGETLASIAERYDVKLEDLRLTNGLKDDLLTPGQVLRIPPGDDS